jgi:hypothetical protein
MPETTMRKGGCHCGQVRYEVKTTLEPLISCNCSICQKRGLMLTFVSPDDFNLLSGEGSQTDYQFGQKRIHHLFCPTCGVSSFATGTKPDGTPSIAVNVRCLDDIDVAELSPVTFNGKSL